MQSPAMYSKNFSYDERLLASLRRVYGCDLPKVLEALARPPKRYYVRVNVLRADPGLVLEILRSKGYEVYHDEYLAEALWLPVRGPFSLPNDIDCHVYVDKFTAESVMMGACVYAPGVVKADQCLRKGREVLVMHGSTPVAYGIAKVSYEQFKRMDRGIVVQVLQSLYEVPSLREEELHAQGLLYEQSYPSMVVTALLDPQPGEVIVDMCAAPGGKTSHIIERSQGLARVIAVDHSIKRLSKLVHELSRLKHNENPNVVVECADSRYLHLDYPQLRGKVDKVLIDPPCSAIGVVPKISDAKSYRDIENLSTYQRQFFKAAYELLKPGGVLVYSVCTITKEEGEDVISWAVSELGFEVVEAKWLYGASRGLPPCEDCLRFHPHVQMLGGYFIAVLRKR